MITAAIVSFFLGAIWADTLLKLNISPTSKVFFELGVLGALFNGHLCFMIFDEMLKGYFP